MIKLFEHYNYKRKFREFFLKIKYFLEKVKKDEHWIDDEEQGIYVVTKDQEVIFSVHINGIDLIIEHHTSDLHYDIYYEELNLYMADILGLNVDIMKGFRYVYSSWKPIKELRKTILNKVDNLSAEDFEIWQNSKRFGL